MHQTTNNKEGQTDGYTRLFVPEFRLYGLQERIAKLNRRAKRLGVPEISIVLTGNREQRDFTSVDVVLTDEGTGEQSRTAKVEAVEIEVTGQSPKLDGWTFAASIDREEESGVNIFNKSPMFTREIPKHFRECTSACDHCKTDRRRNNTFILAHDNGDFKQIGRQCLKDFLGHQNIHALTDSAGIFMAVYELCGEAGEFCGEFGCGKRTITVELEGALICAYNVIQQEGWVSGAQAKASMTGETSTAQRVENLLQGDKNVSGSRTKTREQIIKERDAMRAGDETSRKFVAECIDWVRALGVDNDNEYLANLAAVFSVDFVTYKRLGIAVSAIKAYQREVCKKAEAANKLNECFGTVGERVEAVLTPVKLIDVPTNYGISTLCIFEDEQGRNFKWFASNCPIAEADAGKPVKVKFTIKAHEEYKGRKQTAITRAKLIAA